MENGCVCKTHWEKNVESYTEINLLHKNAWLGLGNYKTTFFLEGRMSGRHKCVAF